MFLKQFTISPDNNMHKIIKRKKDNFLITDIK